MRHDDTKKHDVSDRSSPGHGVHSGGARQDHGVVRLALPWVFLAAAVGAGAVLLKTPPQVPKATPQPVAAVVGVAPLEMQSVRTSVEAFGTVVAARETHIQAEVTGRIVTLHPQMIPGGLVREGDLLFEIDGADYQIAVDEAAAEVNVTRFQIEGLRAGVDALQGRAGQIEAELDYLRWNMERLGRLSESAQAGEAEARDAQSKYASLKAALAALRAQIVEQERIVDRAVAQTAVAESRLGAAKLALERTRIETPFDAIVLSESVELGQLVARESIVATLAATDEFWVEAAVPLARLADIRFSEEGGADGSAAEITLISGEESLRHKGVALRPLGQLDPHGRMARVLVAMHDPLALRDNRSDRARAILLGSYVRLAIDAGELQDVYAIPRYALRENNRVWVRDAQGQLGIRAVEIVWRRQDDVLVRNGFAPGDQLVTTHLASVVPGMPLYLRDQDERQPTAVE